MKYFCLYFGRIEAKNNGVRSAAKGRVDRCPAQAAEQPPPSQPLTLLSGPSTQLIESQAFVLVPHCKTLAQLTPSDSKTEKDSS